MLKEVHVGTRLGVVLFVESPDSRGLQNPSSAFESLKKDRIYGLNATTKS